MPDAVQEGDATMVQQCTEAWPKNSIHIKCLKNMCKIVTCALKFIYVSSRKTCENERRKSSRQLKSRRRFFERKPNKTGRCNHTQRPAIRSNNRRPRRKTGATRYSKMSLSRHIDRWHRVR